MAALVPSNEAKLFVGNLPSDITNEELQYVFSNYGTVSKCHVMDNSKSKSGQACAFVSYTDPQAAAVSIQTLNNVYKIRTDAKEAITVSVAKGAGQTEGSAMAAAMVAAASSGVGALGLQASTAALQPAVPGLPGLSQTALGQPAAAQPAVAQPVDQTAAMQPTLGQPVLAQPALGQTGLAQPALIGQTQPLAQPGLTQPLLTAPGLAQPMLGQPGLAQPLVQPSLTGLGQPGFSQPLFGQPGLATTLDSASMQTAAAMQAQAAAAAQLQQLAAAAAAAQAAATLPTAGLLGAMAPAQPCKLFVGDLPSDIAREALMAVFSTYGTVTDVHLMTGKSRSGAACALVEYSNHTEAHTAIATLHQKYEIKPGSGMITVRHFEGKGKGKGAAAPPVSTLPFDLGALGMVPGIPGLVQPDPAGLRYTPY